MPLAKSLHRDIVCLGQRLENAAFAEEGSRRLGTTATTAAVHHAELLDIIREIKTLLLRIEREIPTLQLAITASGESLSSSLPTGISPSRFLQASFFLNLGDSQFASDPSCPVQIGPVFTLSLYMLFVGHSNTALSQQKGSGPDRPITPDPSRFGIPSQDAPYGFGEGERRPIWQEVLHKARVRLCRTPLGWHFDHNHGYHPPLVASLAQRHSSPGHTTAWRPDEFSYHLEIVEDLNDGRVHDDESKAQPFGDVACAGIRESIPIHQIAKIFYTDSGRILNIGNADAAGNNPVLLLKRDVAAPNPVDLASEHASPSRPTAARALEDASSMTSDEQDAIDRQLREESQVEETSIQEPDKEQLQHPLALQLPAHLDHEWLALEVFEDDNGEDETELSDAENGPPRIQDRGSVVRSERSDPSSTTKSPSMDANILTQIKTLSLRSSTDLTAINTPPSLHSSKSSLPMSSMEPHSTTANTVPSTRAASSSPFGTIISSLSLMEMLIRLTSLQEFQQAAHLSIPDYILSFFLEETSTTGLKGEERWRARDEAKRRVGFDPYTDTPSK